jgi:hypothetical protein
MNIENNVAPMRSQMVYDFGHASHKHALVFDMNVAIPLQPLALL